MSNCLSRSLTGERLPSELHVQKSICQGERRPSRMQRLFSIRVFRPSHSRIRYRGPRHRMCLLSWLGSEHIHFVVPALPIGQGRFSPQTHLSSQPNLLLSSTTASQFFTYRQPNSGVGRGTRDQHWCVPSTSKMLTLNIKALEVAARSTNPTAPLDLNRPINQLNAAKRAQRHTEKEAARKHEDKLLNRTDLDVRGKRLYTLLWLKQMDTIMRRWCEFHTEILGRYSGPEYFSCCTGSCSC